MIHHIDFSQDLLNYVRLNSLRDNDIRQRLREHTAHLPERNMQILPELGQLLSLLVKITGTKKALEIGTFTGYSTLSIAEALPPDGRITALDLNEQWIEIANTYWRQSGIEHKIDFQKGDALLSIEKLISQGQSGTYDFVFIDADKENYIHYYEKSLILLKQYGLIVLDNTLWSGKVTKECTNDSETATLQKLNKLVHKDERVDMVLLPFADGLTLAMKR